MNDEVEPKPADADAPMHGELRHDAETDSPTAHKRVCVGVDFYSCEEAIKRLNDYLDHELNEEERVVVVKHLEICKPCFSRFTFEENLMVSIKKKLCGMAAPQPLKEKLKGLLRQPPKD